MQKKSDIKKFWQRLDIILKNYMHLCKSSTKTNLFKNQKRKPIIIIN